LVKEYAERKQQHYSDTVDRLSKSKDALLNNIRELESRRSQADAARQQAEQDAGLAGLEKGREEDGYNGDGNSRLHGQGSNYREAERKERAARETASLQKVRLDSTTTELASARADLSQLEQRLAAATQAHSQEAIRLDQALLADPRYFRGANDLLSLRLALQKLRQDPLRGELVNQHTLELEVLVIFLDLLLLFIKWAPHNESYSARLAASRRLEIARAVREANQQVSRMGQQRPNIRIVREP